MSACRVLWLVLKISGLSCYWYPFYLTTAVFLSSSPAAPTCKSHNGYLLCGRLTACVPLFLRSFLPSRMIPISSPSLQPRLASPSPCPFCFFPRQTFGLCPRADFVVVPIAIGEGEGQGQHGRALIRLCDRRLIASPPVPIE